MKMSLYHLVNFKTLKFVACLVIIVAYLCQHFSRVQPVDLNFPVDKSTLPCVWKFFDHLFSNGATL